MRFYIAEGKRADQVAKEGLEKVNAQRKKRREFLETFGASGFYEYRGCPPTSIVFEGNGAETKLDGFLKPSRKFENGKFFWVHKPDQRTLIGCTVKARMLELTEFDFSGYAVSEFGLRGSETIGYVGGRMALYRTVAGVVGGKLVFKIPFGGEASGCHDTPTPLNVDVPADLREILHSEFIALGEKKEAAPCPV